MLGTIIFIEINNIEIVYIIYNIIILKIYDSSLIMYPYHLHHLLYLPYISWMGIDGYSSVDFYLERKVMRCFT